MSEPITRIQPLVDHLAQGCKPREHWRIGTEHEKFGFTMADLRPLPYEGEHGIGALLAGIGDRYGWAPIIEADNIIGLKRSGCSITLEPGGQLELSGDLLDNLHETCNEVNSHLAEVRSIAEPMGLGFLGLGFHPSARRDEIPWMPKQRYRIMRALMPKVGSLGLDMMTRTCTVQVNLDFSSESDMVDKFRASLALQPIATALFANSPFLEGKPSGFLSYRSHIWTDTDRYRTGQLPFVFEDGFGFERYVDWMLDVPMYFVRRGGEYIDASGQSFRDFMDGKLPALPGERPTMSDWDDHLTTAFPEVRLKKFLEMRGADGGPWKRLCALPAFWVGLLYDSGSLEACRSIFEDWSTDDLTRLRDDVSRDGLRAEIHGRSVHDIARDLLELARNGLRNRKRLNAAGDDETGFLEPLHATVESGRTPADTLLELYNGEWGGSMEPLFRTRAYY